MNFGFIVEFPGRPVVVLTRNGTSISFDLQITPPVFPGSIESIYVYPKLLRNDNNDLVHSAVNRHQFSRHERNLNVAVTGQCSPIHDYGK